MTGRRRAEVEGVLEGLSVAIAAIMEDSSNLAVQRPQSPGGYADLASDLSRAGCDISTLAAAMVVLARREPSPR